MTDYEINEDVPNMSFTTDTAYIRDYLEAMAAVRDEGKMIVSSDNVFSKLADPTNAMMCISRIKGRALNGIEVNNAEKVQIGARWEELDDLLSGVKATSEVNIKFPVVDKAKNTLNLHIIDEDIQFTDTTLDPETVPGVPENDPLSHKTRVVISGKDLKKAITHAKKKLDPDEHAIVMGTEDDSMYMEASDQIEGSFRKTFHQSGPSDSNGLGNHETKIGFGYLDDIYKIFGKADEVTIHIKDSHPIRFDLDLDDNGDAQIIYIIAPRIESE